MLETDYSYAAETFCGPGFFLCGDAACFLDPLLSTGVHLAMLSALLGAASVASLLRGEVSEAAGAVVLREELPPGLSPLPGVRLGVLRPGPRQGLVLSRRRSA